MKTSGLDIRKTLSLLLIPVYLTLTVIFLILNIGTSFNPPILLLVFNSLFLGLIPLYVAYIAHKSFIASGSTGVLLKGTGMLVLGLGAIGAGLVNYLPDSMNANVTVQNTGFCIAAFLQFVGILIALSGTAPRQRSSDASRISLLYGGCIAAFSAFIIAAVSGTVPPFFIQGTGFTALREFVITSAIEFFILASGVLLWLYYKKREGFFFWYSVGMALIGIGLLAVHFPSVLGSPLGWVGRSAQYLGGVYLLVAFVTLNRNARRTGIPVSDMLSRFFGEAETSYRTLIEAATDAIVVFDSADRVIVWNRAAGKMFGYTPDEAIGESFFRMVIPDEFTDAVKSNFRAPVTPEADLSAHTSVEITARRKDGSTFPVEVALSRHIVAGTWVSTCIIRDLTERRKAEQALRESEERYRTRFNALIEGFCVIEMVFDPSGKPVDYRFLEINAAFEAQTGLHDAQGKLMRSLAPDHEQHWFDIYGKIAVTGEPAHFEQEAAALGRWFDVRAFRVGGEGSRKVAICFNDISDRRKAEAALKESEEKFRVLIQNLQSAVALIDEHGAFSIVNPSFLSMFGIPADADILNVNSQDWSRWQVFDEDGTLLDVDRHPVRKAALTGRAVKNQLVGLKTPTGTDLKWLLVSAEPILDAHGGIHRIICTYYDITDRRKAEEERRQSEERYHDLFTSMNEGFILAEVVTDGNGRPAEPADYRYLDVNTAGEQFFGHSRSAIVGTTYRALGGGRADEEWIRALNQVALTGEPASLERYAPVGGHWVSLKAYSPRSGQFAALFEDITDRKKAEDALRESETRFRLALKNAPVSVALQDTNLIYRWAYNQTTRQSDEIVGKTDADLFAPEDVAWLAPLKHRILETGDDVHTENWLTSNGQRVYLDLYFEPMRNKEGEITGIGIAAVNLTDLKLAKDELQRTNDELNALNEELSSTEEELHQNLEELAVREEKLSKALAEKEVLLSEIHHRVKNNLTAFISLLSLEGSIEDTPEGKQLKLDLQNRARSMALVHETLYRTHLFNDVDMEMYLTTLLEQIGNSFRTTRAVKTVVDAHGVMLDIPRATPAGLIVNELVTNSFKYSFPESFDVQAVRDAPPTIGVTLTRNNGTYEMIVRDNGIGLPPGFDLAKTKTLGLKLVNFLARHQMRANVEVKSDNGTEFIFRFKE